jgi:cell wall-associated NlpC family hydrolase
LSAPPGQQLAAAAESLVGTPFRLHGRDPRTGLDCVGLIGEALRRCGLRPVAPAGYRLRMVDLRPLLGFAAANGLRELASGTAVAAGDILLVHLHGLQPHLLLAVGDAAFVHAHAGLGCVVRQPGPPPGPTAAHWRLDRKG